MHIKNQTSLAHHAEVQAVLHEVLLPAVVAGMRPKDAEHISRRILKHYSRFTRPGSFEHFRMRIDEALRPNGANVGRN